MKRIYIMLSAIGLLLMASCEKTSLTSGVVTSRKIRPVVSTGPMTKTSTGIQDIDNLKSDGFNMEIIADANYENGSAGKFGGTRTVSWTDGSWSISPVAYWINDTPMSFWAYNKVAVSDCDITNPGPNATEVSFTYPKSDVIPDGKTDVMFSYVKRNSHEHNHTHIKGDEYDQISLEFKHAFSKICFEKGIFTGADGYSISKIKLMGIKTSGNATFNETGFTWSNQGNAANFEFTSVSDYLLAVPQNTQTVNIEVTLTHATKSDIVLSSHLKDHLMEAGKYYNYRLNVNNGQELSVSLSVNPWDLQERNLELTESNVTSFVNKDTYHGGDIDAANSKIFIHNGMPVTGSFTLTSPKGAKLLLALDGNLDAFEVTPKICYVDGNPINFSITPIVADPKIDYQTRLHIYLVGSDGSVSELDELVMKEASVYKHYTIILPAQ